MEFITRICDKLIKKYKTRDPATIAELLGINLWYRDLNGLKGFYLYERRSRYIIINSALEANEARVVIAHELGHDALHRNLAKSGIRETTLFLTNDKTEKQANIFAAELLISDEEFMKLAADYESYDHISFELGLPIEIIGYKIECLNRRGVKLKTLEYKNNFLK